MVADLSGARFPWVTKGAGSDGRPGAFPRSCRHGLAGMALAGLPVPRGQPL